MKKILKVTGIALLSIIMIVLLGYAYITYSINTEMKRVYEFAPHRIDVSRDSSSLELGKHLVLIRGCVDCHGADLGGKLMNDDFGIGTLPASNLTKGKGGLQVNYSIEDWTDALRHGIAKDGKPLLFMPSHESAPMSDQDIGAIIAYVESLPLVDNVLPEMKAGPIAEVLAYFDMIPMLSVKLINHDAVSLKRTDTMQGIAQGKYLSVSCQSCHRVDMRGGDPLAPGQPPVPDITSTGAAGWSESAFINALRTGITPTGKHMRNEDMPWKMTSHYTDQEIKSLYKYLKSI